VPHSQQPGFTWTVATTSKYASGTKFRISSSRLQTMAKVGVFTLPTPMTVRAPRAKVTVAVRVSDRL
jgi:hypothetical protein